LIAILGNSAVPYYTSIFIKVSIVIFKVCQWNAVLAGRLPINDKKVPVKPSQKSISIVRYVELKVSYY
jgi:hypothetical protein